MWQASNLFDFGVLWQAIASFPVSIKTFFGPSLAGIGALLLR
jgi:hypothetical protein